MSWDLWLTIYVDTGGSEKVRMSLGEWNYTYNTSPMLRDAGIDLRSFVDKQASDVIPVLERGIENLKGAPAKYRAMNPSNGWGDYDGILACMEDILSTFKAHPLGIVSGCF